MSNELEKVAGFYNEGQGFKKDWGNLHSKLVKERYSVLAPYFKKGIFLELGIADGEFTQYLLDDLMVESLVGIEGSKEFVNQCENRFLKNKCPHKFIHTLFEDYEHEPFYNTILAMHILEHLDDPVSVLKLASKWLKDDGHLIINVPNAISLHRMAGVKMGMLAKEKELHSLDNNLGHKRVYDMILLKKHIEEAGLSVINSGGLFLKPISNAQIQKDWSDELIQAYFSLGQMKEFHCYAAEIWMVCKK